MINHPNLAIGVRITMPAMELPTGHTQSSHSAPSGTLWVVATPIGHLEDMSPRAKAILETVPVVAAEDTRVSRRLVRPAPNQRWVSLHEHNEAAVLSELINRLEAGDDVALVSDAGTPLISDPGYRLVAAAHQHGIRVSPVPGPSALTAALSTAGLATDRFLFEGFLPAKSAARQARLRALHDQPCTLIFYVPARDLDSVLADMQAIFGDDRAATLAREITKQHETIYKSDLKGLLHWVQFDPNQLRGEAVLVLAGHPSPPPMITPSILAPLLKEALPPSQASRILAAASGMSRQQAWQMITGEIHAREQDADQANEGRGSE